MALTRDELQAMLDHRDGFWDRPDTDWGDPVGDLEDKTHANSCYRLARKAVRRDNPQDLAAAENWSGISAAAGHPGGAFLSLLCYLRGPQGAERSGTIAERLIRAAEAGHGDAQRLANELVARSGHAKLFPEAPDDVQEPEFLDEVLQLIGFEE